MDNTQFTIQQCAMQVWITNYMIGHVAIATM